MVYYILSIGEKLGEIIDAAFSVNLTEFLINLIATIALILIVRFCFWNKVTSFLDKKKESIKKEYEESNNIKEEALEIKAQALSELKESKEKSDLIINEAIEEGNLEKDRIIKEAKDNAKKIVDDSKEEALREREEIIKEAKDEVVDIASILASKIIDSEIDHNKYNDKLLEELDD